MSSEDSSQRELLARVAVRLLEGSSRTDHLMLTRWRVLSICQHYLGTHGAEAELACKIALEVFALQGSCAACDSALNTAVDALRHSICADTVLPSISEAKRAEVVKQLDAIASDGRESIDRAMSVVSFLRRTIKVSGSPAFLPGLSHRFGLVADILENPGRKEAERVRAAAAVLYVNEVDDVVSDALGVVGMVDDDYALRIVLAELGEAGTVLHWAETIASLWDDLPFLRGMRLQRNGEAISVTWLDRVNSFVAYDHVLKGGEEPLVLLQPAVTCIPLHALLSLIGLVVLDAVTSFQGKAHALRLGRVYEVDGFVVRFDGLAGVNAPKGWIRLRFRDGVTMHSADLADRMVPVEDRRLSSTKEFSRRRRTLENDPVQKFFGWSAAIGPASIASRVVLVSSRGSAQELLEGVESNGVRLLDHGLVRFVGNDAADIEAHGSLVLVVPSLRSARALCERGVQVQAIFVDGYQRFNSGRHDLPFLKSADRVVPVIVWSAAGYYPSANTGNDTCRILEVLPDDLASVLELDDHSADVGHAALWESATGLSVTSLVQAPPLHEVEIVDAIEAYLGELRSSTALPDYWKYHLVARAKVLRSLITATPSRWSDIRAFSAFSSAAIDEKWSKLRASAVLTLAAIRDAEKHVDELIKNVSSPANARADALRTFLASSEIRDWVVGCEYIEQVKAATSALQAIGHEGTSVLLVQDLPPCNHCVVAGWTSTSFARRLWAHTPRKIVALVSQQERSKWQRAATSRRHPGARSLLASIGGSRSPVPYSSRARLEPSQEGESGPQVEGWEPERVPCVFIWISGEDSVKVLASDARVLVERERTAEEHSAQQLHANDRVILSRGIGGGSPNDEFTAAVVKALAVSRPELVSIARSWRSALLSRVRSRGLSVFELRRELAAVGIVRENQTLEGWLDLENPSPIAPRNLRDDLKALRPLIEEFTEHSFDALLSACIELRAVRNEAGRALLEVWKGGRAQDALGIDEAVVRELADQLRREVQVCEVETVKLGSVPVAMLGWWISSDLAERYES